MASSSKGEFACSIMDTDGAISEKTISAISAIVGVLRVRSL